METVEKRQAEFRLFRDKVLLGLGTTGLVGLGFAAVFIGFKNDAIAIALLTVFGGILGVPGILRLDEKRSSE